ncbi:MAG: hypothetical protein NZ891_00850, partial [bacterium]|nr:hypothetical protein [bacterium]MDW8163281.1 hypothetical protein [Candidatus Omnitrophota bacterium]
TEINLNFNREFIEVSRVNDLKEMEEVLNNEDNVRKIGMLYNESFYILKFKNFEKYFKEKNDYIELDSFLVDNFLINELIEIKENTEFFYHSSKEYLIKEYEKRKKGAIFFLRPVKKSIFIKMCLDGKIMPQKTTYFYPKVPSGLVIYKF